MRMTADPAPGGGPMVQGFGAGGFRVDGVVHRAVLLTVASATPWTPPSLADLTVDELEPLIAVRPEFILIGTGAALVRPPVTLTRTLEARDIGLEPMDSRAAARAWGVLRGEGRVVAAALYPLA